MKRKIIPYNPNLKELARQLRNNSTRAEIRLWNYLKGRQIGGYDFHRQKPLGNYIADFYCAELELVIEVDGYSHNFEEVVNADINKENEFKSFGLEVIRFDDNEIMSDMNNVLCVLEGYIENRENGHTPGPSVEGSEEVGQ